MFKDAHGDVLSAYSSTTNKLADYAYDAWGEQRSVGDYEWGNANPIRYNGQYYDTESGMTYLRARYYDSSFRRFITEDPIKDGLNWYAYCENNPVMLVDPFGFGPIDDALHKEYINIEEYENKIANLDFTQYEDEELYYRYLDKIETSKSAINAIFNNTVVLDVPQFYQLNHKRGENLCWACCEAMVIAYLKGDNIDRTYEIALYEGYFFARRWLSCEEAFGAKSLNISQHSGRLSQEILCRMLDKGYPIPIRYGTRGNNGHFVVITGHSQINGEIIFTYNDPATGGKNEKNYGELKTYNGWTWTHTVTNWSEVGRIKI